MADGLLMLLLLSFVMAATSFAAGLLPLSWSLSPRKLRLITALGTGILVGTSLIVIIPEGIDTLYSASESGHSHVGRSIVPVGRETHIAPSQIFARVALQEKEAVDQLSWPGTELFGGGERRNIGAKQVRGENDGAPADTHDTDLPNGDYGREPHVYVGLALISGFILMFLIDTLPQHSRTPSQPQRFHVSLNQFSLYNRTSSNSTETPMTPSQTTFSDSANHSHSSPSSRPSSTTIGLVIHATADGIALGASSTTTSRLTFIIFIALMIHKAPAAFGLTSVLLKQGLSTRTARTHLIVFALAAPVGALLTWSAAHLLGYTSSTFGNNTSTEFATGVLLLFSAGTFLYVAVHTMQGAGSIEHSSDSDANEADGYAGVPMHEMYPGEAGRAPQPHKKELSETLATVAGMLLPLLTQWGHSH